MVKKTPAGTIYAESYGKNDGTSVTGICLGTDFMGDLIALEYDPEEKRLNLILSDEKIKECGIHVKHVDSAWKEI